MRVQFKVQSIIIFCRYWQCVNCHSLSMYISQRKRIISQIWCFLEFNGFCKRMFNGGSLEFYLCTRADYESSSNLRALKGKHKCFSIFMTSTWAQKAKLTVNFLAFPSVNSFKTWLSCNHMRFLWNTLFLWKSVRANPIYLEKWQITEYRKNRLNNLHSLPIQNVRQYHFHDVAKYEKNSPKESVDIK